MADQVRGDAPAARRRSWNTVRLEGDVADAVRKLKAEPGPELQVHGSGTLIQTLLKNDPGRRSLWLKIFPVTIGSGRRLFAEGTAYAGFELVESSASPSGVILAKYRRAGDVKSGSFVARAASPLTGGADLASLEASWSCARSFWSRSSNCDCGVVLALVRRLCLFAPGRHDLRSHT